MSDFRSLGLKKIKLSDSVLEKTENINEKASTCSKMTETNEYNEYVSNVYKNIIKSQEDSRTYLGLELVNGMRVLLISDPTTDKSAAALDVRIGFYSDPFDLPGLAHFCEHMLFLGNAKYPAENEYTQFILQHGGSSNAFTSGENTCFYFDVASNFLKESLDRFAQFFICPLFTESSTKKEVNAINSEHEKNLQNDTWRTNQLEKATCNQEHDFSKFGTGNIETLWNIPISKGISIRDELLKFHEKYYSSNIMGLVVFGKESIEELKDFVVPLFSKVINKHVEIPEWNEHPFDADHVKLQGFVVPVKDLRQMNITFPIPDLQPLYKSNPAEYLSHLIGHECSGSLLSQLKGYGWANKLITGYKAGGKGFATFIATCDLTEEGLDHVYDIITHFFQYLAMLRVAGPQEWIFEEIKNIASMTFRFKDREKPLPYSYSLAGMLFDYPMEEILCGIYMLHEYRPDHINNLLDMLTPETIRIAIVGQKYSNICDEVEKWYGTHYKLQPVPENLLNIWRNVKPHSSHKLPVPNEFIPSSFDLVRREQDNPKFPQLIKNTAMGHLWFKQDDEFLLPKTSLNIELESPVAYLDPLHSNMNSIFAMLIMDSLNEYTYAAELAGLSYFLKSTKLGIYLNIRGYSDKQHVLLKKIMDRFTNFKINEKRFNIWKEELHRTLKNFRAEQPHRHAVYFTTLLLSERTWSNDELLNCVEEITLEAMQDMIPRLLSKVHIEALFHGNLTKKQALSLMNIVESALERNTSSRYMIPSQLSRHREVHLSDGGHYIYEAVNDVHNCSCVEVYFQCGLQETRSNMILELICEMMFEPCFNFLRTQEQLGYIVSSGARRSDGAQGLRIVVQSDKFPSYIDGRIEAFVQYFDRYIQDMGNEVFCNHVQSLSVVRLEKPKKLHMLAIKHWHEISSRQYNFDRDNIEVAVLQTITKDEVYAYFKELIAYDAPKRKKLSVHIKSSKLKSTSETPDVQFPCTPEPRDGLIPPPPAFRPPEKIQDIVAFKHGVGLYPLVSPFIYIPPAYFGKSKL